MSKLVKFSIIQLCIWTMVGIGMGIVFASSSVSSTWADHPVKTVLLAILFLIGFGTDFVLRIIEGSKKWGFKRDERDMAIQSRAMSYGFLFIVLYIFVIAMFLFMTYETVGSVPVGWVWFMAYSTIVVSNLSVGILSLIYYSRQGY